MNWFVLQMPNRLLITKTKYFSSHISSRGWQISYIVILLETPNENFNIMLTLNWKLVNYTNSRIFLEMSSPVKVRFDETFFISCRQIIIFKRCFFRPNKNFCVVDVSGNVKGKLSQNRFDHFDESLHLYQTLKMN